MDTENQDPGQNIPEETQAEPIKESLEITDEIKDQLSQAGGWGKFLSILGFIFMGFMILFGFMMSAMMAFVPNQYGGLPFPTFLFGFIYLVIAIVYFFPILYLYRFSSGIKQALRLNNQNQLAKAFLYLKAHYRFMGILMIVFIGIYILAFILMVFFGMFAGLSAMSGTRV